MKRRYPIIMAIRDGYPEWVVVYPDGYRYAVSAPHAAEFLASTGAGRRKLFEYFSPEDDPGLMGAARDAAKERRAWRLAGRDPREVTP